jgi:hypothetical protein
MKKIHHFVAVSALLLLSACGGGSPDSGAIQAGAIDPYVGKWLSPSCGEPTSSMLRISDNTPTRIKEEVTISKVSGVTANVKLTDYFYAEADTNCAGTPIASLVRTGESTGSESIGATGLTSSYGPNTLTHVGTKTLADGTTVDRLTLQISKLTVLGGATITAGPIKINLPEYVAGFTALGIAKFNNSAQMFLQFADTEPSVLTTLTTEAFNKQ